MKRRSTSAGRRKARYLRDKLDERGEPERKR
jgi:hypothetical protein